MKTDKIIKNIEKTILQREVMIRKNEKQKEKYLDKVEKVIVYEHRIAEIQKDKSVLEYMLYTYFQQTKKQ